MSEPKYPHVHVRLSGEDGNAFSIIARVQSALRSNGVKGDELEQFLIEACAGNYDHLLRTVMRWVKTS